MSRRGGSAAAAPLQSGESRSPPSRRSRASRVERMARHSSARPPQPRRLFFGIKYLRGSSLCVLGAAHAWLNVCSDQIDHEERRHGTNTDSCDTYDFYCVQSCRCLAFSSADRRSAYAQQHLITIETVTSHGNLHYRSCYMTSPAFCYFHLPVGTKFNLCK